MSAFSAARQCCCRQYDARTHLGTQGRTFLEVVGVVDVQVPAADLGRRDVEAVHRGRLCLPVDPAAVGVLVTHTHYTTTNTTTNTNTTSPSPVNCVSTVYANSNNKLPLQP